MHSPTDRVIQPLVRERGTPRPDDARMPPSPAAAHLWGLEQLRGSSRVGRPRRRRLRALASRITATLGR